MLSFAVAVLVYILTNSRLLYLFLHILTAFTVFWFLHDSHSNWGNAKTSLCVFIYISLMLVIVSNFLVSDVSNPEPFVFHSLKMAYLCPFCFS